MIFKEYIKRKDDNEGCNVIDTSYNSIKNASNKTQYLFFKLKFNNLIKETEIMKLQFVLNYYKIQNSETITIYETPLTSIDNQTISNFVNEIDSQYFPKRKEYIFEDTKDDNEAIHSAVFDLKELDFELSSNKDTIVFMLKFNFTIDDRLQSLIDDQELNYDCYALLTKSTISLNQYSKIDTYDLDGNAKIIVDNKNGELFTSLDLISTMSNKNPISLSLIGNRENYFNEELFLKPLRFTFQASIDVFNDLDNKNVIYLKNAYHDLSKFIEVENINDSKYKDIIKTHDGDEGIILFNDLENTYIYYDEESMIFKLYDKHDNCSKFIKSNRITKLIQTKTKDNKIINYNWNNNLLLSIESSEGDKLFFEYDSHNYVNKIYDQETMLSVEIYNHENYMEFKYYKETTLLKTLTLYINEDNELTRMYETQNNTLYDIDYFGVMVNSITKKKTVRTDVDTYIPSLPPIGDYLDPSLPIIPTNNQNASTLSMEQVTQPNTEIVVLEQYNYDYIYGDIRITNHLNETLSRFYDDFGRCILEMDSNGNAVSMEYSGCMPYLLSKSMVVNQTHNIVNNHSFEEGKLNNINNWDLQKNSSSSVELDNDGVYGKCLKINKKGNGEVKLSQTVNLEPNNTYQLKLFTKYSLIEENDLEIVLKVKYQTDTEQSFEIKNNPSSGFSTKFNLVTLEQITIPENATDIQSSIELLVKGNSEKTVYFDEVTIVSNDRNLRHNLLKNADFSQTENSKPKNWVLVNDTPLDIVKDKISSNIPIIKIGKYMQFDSSSVIKINEEEKTKKMYQIINKKGNAKEVYTLSILSKCSLSFYDNLKAYVKFFYFDGTEEKFSYSFLKECESLQILIKTVSPSKIFNLIEVGVEYDGTKKVEIDNIQLYRGGKVQYCNYSQTGDINEVSNGNGNIVKVFYNKDKKVDMLISSDGTVFKYEYEGEKIKSISSSKNSQISYTYDENDNIISKIYKCGYETLSDNYNYDSENNLIFHQNMFGEVFRKEYDLFRRVTEEISPNGLVSNYTYDDFNNLLSKESTVDSLLHKNSLTYIDSTKIYTIESPNGSVYKYEYDKYDRLVKISINDVELNTFTYCDTENLKTNYVLEKRYNNANYYSFAYDSKKRLKEVFYKNQKIVEYEYDENGNISFVYDRKNNIKKYYTFDVNNKLIKITDRNGMNTSFYYDNQNNIQKVNRNTTNKSKSTEYDHEYESNEITFDAYVHRLAKTYGDDVFVGLSNGYGRNGTPQQNGLFDVDAYLDSDNILVQTISKGKDYFTINAHELNKGIKEGMLYDKPYNSKEYYNKYKTTKSFVMWIKPKNTFQSISLLKTRNTLTGQYIEDINLGITEEGKLRFFDRKNTSIYYYDSIDSLKLNEWNLIVLKVKNNKADLYLNNKKVEIPDLAGAEYSLYGINVFKTDGIIGDTELTMPIDLGYLSIGCYDYLDEDIKAIYKEGLKCIAKNNVNYRNSNIRYLYGTLGKDYNIVSLNGSLESNKNHEPIILNKLENSYNLSKNSMFEYDELLGRYMYSSFNTDLSERVNLGKLAYDLAIKEEGVISVKFKMVGASNRARNILSSSCYDDSILDLYVFDNLLKLRVNDVLVNIEDVNILDDTWYTLTLFINKDENNNTKFNIYLNTTLKATYTTSNYFTLENCETYIGRNSKLLNSELDGYLEKLVWKNSKEVETSHQSKVNTLHNVSYQIEHKYYIDKMSRLLTKEIHTGTRVLHHKLDYNYTRLVHERMYDNKEKIYDYDNEGNVSYVNEDGTITRYYYDNLNRLKVVNSGTKRVEHQYDKSGNIQRIVTRVANAIVEEEVFIYDSTHKDHLKFKKKYINGTLSENIEYVYNGHYLLRIIDRQKNITNNITYEGNKMISYGINEYRYNEEGVRIYKKASAYNQNNVMIGYNIHNYEVEGNLILSETIQTVQNGVIRFDYNYDYNGQLLSVEFQNQVYYYNRDCLGTICSIIDKNGNTVVSYKYNSWGKVEETLASDPSHPLALFNPFLYKGYYYDVETGLFWLSSRYYSPELCRFISPDDVEYLDPESINGLNLYAYANNNPIMYYDPSGHIAISTIILLACIGVGALVGGTYAGVTAYNDGARGWELVGWTALGAVVGGAVGGLVGYYAGPMAASLFGSSGGLAFAGGLGSAGVAISGTMAGTLVTAGAIGLTYAGALAASGVMMFAKGNGPRMGHNQYENKQFNSLCNKYKLTKEQRRILHDYISGQNYSYHEIEQIIKELFFS